MVSSGKWHQVVQVVTTTPEVPCGKPHNMTSFWLAHCLHCLFVPYYFHGLAGHDDDDRRYVPDSGGLPHCCPVSNDHSPHCKPDPCHSLPVLDLFLNVVLFWKGICRNEVCQVHHDEICHPARCQGLCPGPLVHLSHQLSTADSTIVWHDGHIPGFQ